MGHLPGAGKMEQRGTNQEMEREKEGGVLVGGGGENPHRWSKGRETNGEIYDLPDSAIALSTRRFSKRRPDLVLTTGSSGTVPLTAQNIPLVCVLTPLNHDSSFLYPKRGSYQDLPRPQGSLTATKRRSVP